MRHEKRYHARINVYLEGDQRDHLRDLARATHTSESDLIRRAVRHLIESQTTFVPVVCDACTTVA